MFFVDDRGKWVTMQIIDETLTKINDATFIYRRILSPAECTLGLLVYGAHNILEINSGSSAEGKKTHVILLLCNIVDCMQRSHGS